MPILTINNNKTTSRELDEPIAPQVEVNHLLYLVCDAKKRIVTENPTKDDKNELYAILSDIEQKIVLLRDGGKLSI